MSSGRFAAFVAKTTGKWIAGLTAFGLISVAGGVLASGFVLPGVTALEKVTEGASELFDSLPQELGEEVMAQKSYIYWKDGSLMATYYDENRDVVPLSEISQYMQDAVVALEDKRFWEHGGVDLIGMARAFVKNSGGDDDSGTQGASTLTQQYVKNILIEQALAVDDYEGVRKATEVTYSRKLREVKLALSLEKQLTKEQILEGYLNIAQFGLNLYGVQAAAQYYFGVDAADLNLVQSATIAAITSQPTGHDPTKHPEANKTIRDATLKVMLEEGYISKSEYDAAVAQTVESTLDVHPTSVGCQKADSKTGAGFFCDYVTYVIKNSEEFGKTVEERVRLLKRGGLKIYTTLDKSVQTKAKNAVEDTVPKNDTSALGIALSSVEPGTGEILAMAQNRDFTPGQTSSKKRSTSVNYNTDFDYGGSSGFQVGSTFKVFILAEWLKQGHGLNEHFAGNRSDYSNSVWQAKGCTDSGTYTVQGQWTPANSTRDLPDATAVSATAWSVNRAYIAMEYRLDLCSILKTLETMGIHRADYQEWNIGPSMVLGTNEVAPLTMAAAYATFASGGIYCRPIAITRVTGADGEDLDVPQPDCQRVMSKDVAYGVAAAMKAVLTQGTGTTVQLEGYREAAGKTGTTDEQIAVTFGGFTPQVATFVWVGGPDRNTSMRGLTINGEYYDKATGGRLPGKAWKIFMNDYLRGKEEIKFPVPNEQTQLGEQVEVPSVIGKTLYDAQKIADESGFLVKESSQEYDNTVPEGTIIWQSPLPDSKIYPSQSYIINVTVSKGPKPNDAEDEDNVLGEDSGGGDDEAADDGGGGSEDEPGENEGRER
jgi:membrane peptidoglycan carboxypeptidase